MKHYCSLYRVLCAVCCMYRRSVHCTVDEPTSFPAISQLTRDRRMNNVVRESVEYLRQVKLSRLANGRGGLRM